MKKTKKPKLRIGTGMKHKQSGNSFLLTDIEYELTGKLPGDDFPRQLYLSKKAIMAYFDFKSETKPDEDEVDIFD